MILGDLGADVIKVERPGGDDARAFPPFWGGESCMFLAVNRNKRSIELDLKSQVDLQVARRLIQGADVLIESFRPGVMDRLGIGYESARQANPRLIYCSVSNLRESRAGRQPPWL